MRPATGWQPWARRTASAPRDSGLEPHRVGDSLDQSPRDPFDALPVLGVERPRHLIQIHPDPVQLPHLRRPQPQLCRAPHPLPQRRRRR